MRGRTILALAAVWEIPDRLWIMGFVFIGVAVAALCLAGFFRRFRWATFDFDMVLRRILWPYWGILLGSFVLCFGVHEILQYRQVLKDDVRTMGVVTKVHSSTRSMVSTIHLVFMDDQGVEHRLATSWYYDLLNRPDIHQRLPVIYYRPDPNLAVVDDFGATFFPPWIMLLVGTCFVAISAVELYRRVRIGTEKGAFILFRGISAVILRLFEIAEALVRFLKQQSNNKIYYDEEEIDDTPTAQALINDLGDEDPMVREYAAKELRETGDKHAIQPLTKALKDEEQSVRKAAKESLIQVLIRTLDDEDRRARATAAKALGQIGGNRAIKPLAKALKDKDQAVRAAAKEALALVKNKLGPEEWETITQKRAEKLPH
ncbi:MAG: HEAT repeat domain-containing protein [Planctomycetota bacterium]